MIFETEKEMWQGIEVLVNFDDCDSREAADSLRESKRPIYILGMGSSLLFPAKNAKNRAFSLLPERRVEIGYPNNFNASHFPQDAYVFLNSNSGGTVEILDIAEKLLEKDIDFYGVTNRSDSKLAEICKNKHILQGQFEKGVAATKSIIDQALFYDAVIHCIAGKEFPLGKNKKLTAQVSAQMKNNFNRNLSKKALYFALNADTFYWIDHNAGVGEELALKSCEIAGKRGIYESGTQILHGRGEVIRPFDLIIVGGYDSYPEKDKKGLMELADKVGAKILTLEDNKDNVPNLSAETTKDYEGYSQLPAAWNLLKLTGNVIDRNIDNPKVAKKYRKE